MYITECIGNDIQRDATGIWKLMQPSDFKYSDGKRSENYLNDALDGTNDLSTHSEELEKHIRDWPTQYHLSHQRSQLISGFNFDNNSDVLEIGAGCGAISRYLGETFKHVISIEGDSNRAIIASKRTKDLESVSILCAPFQEIEFKKKFDLIFCIGVLEYSGKYNSSPKPYEETIKYFSKLLKEDGMLFLAIENQFGLKYFLGSNEDHICKKQQGLEGYHFNNNEIKTFGKNELRKLLEKEFSFINYYYPYPDYKLPDCIISDDFINSGQADELVMGIQSIDHCDRKNLIKNEIPIVAEINKNDSLAFFSNSFITIASNSAISPSIFNQQAIYYSANRRRQFRTYTRIIGDSVNTFQSVKKNTHPSRHNDDYFLIQHNTTDDWEESYSIQTLLLLKCFAKPESLDDFFSICKPWANQLLNEAKVIGGQKRLDGKLLDATWRNAYLHNDSCIFIDQEWEWHKPIPINILIIRSIFNFLLYIENRLGFKLYNEYISGYSIIKIIAMSLGITLKPGDFIDFIKFESKIISGVYSVTRPQAKRLLITYLIYRNKIGN